MHHGGGGSLYEASDREKEAFGIEFYLGALTRHLRKPVQNVKMLDVGGGTGNFTQELLLSGVGHLTLLDASERMLEKASAKLAQMYHSRRVEFHQSLLPAIPFPEQCFDAVTFNMVLHHLDNDKGQFHTMGRAFHNARRVLKPGGLLFINTATPEQMKCAYWYHFLIPKASDMVKARYPDVAIIHYRLKEAGFRLICQNVPLEAVPQGKSYFDYNGPLYANWRAGNSIWSYVADEELDKAMVTVNQLKTDGRLEASMFEHDKERRKIGQVTIFCAIMQ